MGFNVLMQFHPMVGYDFHVPPPPPAGQLTAQILFGTSLTSTYSEQHWTTWAGGYTMGKGTDIGPLIIPHAPAPPIPPLRLAYIIPLSASKSHFGSSKYKIKDGTSCGVAVAVYVNLNLNCGEPVPTPTGIVIAINTHEAGMTLGDLLAGIFSMVLDFVIQSLLNKYGSALGRALIRKLAPKLLPALTRGLYNLVKRLPAGWFGKPQLVSKLIDGGIGLIMGSPLGASISSIAAKLGLPNIAPYDLLREHLPTGTGEWADSESIITGLVDGPNAGSIL